MASPHQLEIPMEGGCDDAALARNAEPEDTYSMEKEENISDQPEMRIMTPTKEDENPSMIGVELTEDFTEENPPLKQIKVCNPTAIGNSSSSSTGTLFFSNYLNMYF